MSPIIVYMSTQTSLHVDFIISCTWVYCLLAYISTSCVISNYIKSQQHSPGIHWWNLQSSSVRKFNNVHSYNIRSRECTIKSCPPEW